jgi:hypothetical protein
MKVFVIHDTSGRIRGALAAASGSTNIAVKGTSDLRLHTMEVADMEDAERRRFLTDLHKHHRVIVGPAGGMRVRDKRK